MILLKRNIGLKQWMSLLILFVGVAIIQFENISSTEKEDANKNPVLGLVCVLIMCILSGLCSAYFEKILKGSSVSIWIRNIQLGTISTIFSLVGVYTTDGESIKERGFFFGYNFIVWLNIFIQSFGGLLVAVVIKFADSILKGFATSLAIIVSCFASVYLFKTQINLIFVIGTFFVVISTLKF